ncbi:hypothetical protein GCM10007854_11990 [Algimonas porphyrae]|uniref:DUF975 family protein n=3 Tax=Algimonas porphyrae TaxID=1128113 RepID=A0ABQ5UZA6_9PROT|nr:hypothetical protein GCM10007854_11990 [Algimonas porphyrae]
MKPIEPTPYTRDYEITDAMFGAFRSPGGAKLFWILTAYLTIALTIIYLLLLPPMAASYGRMILSSMDSSTGAMMSELGKVMMFVFVLIVLSFSANAIVRAAFYRAYFFGVDDGLFPFRFGRDEVQQALAILGFYALVYVVAIAGGIIIGLVFGFAGVMMGESAFGFAIFLGFIFMIALMVVIYWFMVVISPAGALTALRGNTHVLAARHVSKGRRGAIFGSIFVAGLIGYIAYYALSTAGFLSGLSGLMSAELFSAILAEDSQEVVDLVQQAVNSPGFKAGLAVALFLMSAGMAFFYMIIAGPQAYFTKQWADAAQDVPYGQNPEQEAL